MALAVEGVAGVGEDADGEGRGKEGEGLVGDCLWLGFGLGIEMEERDDGIVLIFNFE